MELCDIQTKYDYRVPSNRSKNPRMRHIKSKNKEMDSQLINFPNREKPDENLNIMDILDQKRQLLIQIKCVKSEIIELEKAYKQQIYKTESLLLQNSPLNKDDEYLYSDKVLLLENILKTENSQFKISKKSFTDDLKDALFNEIIEYKQLIRSSSREYIKKRNDFIKVQNLIDEIHKNSNIEMVETQNIIIDDLKDELSLLKSKELKFQEELKSLVTDSITPNYDGVEYATLCEQYEKLKYYHTKKLLAKKELEKRNKKELEKALERQREINREINERAERERFRTTMKSRISSSKMSRRESRAIEFLENQKKSKLQQRETISYDLNKDELLIDRESKNLSEKILGQEIPDKNTEKSKEKSDIQIENADFTKNHHEKQENKISSNKIIEISEGKSDNSVENAEITENHHEKQENKISSNKIIEISKGKSDNSVENAEILKNHHEKQENKISSIEIKEKVETMQPKVNEPDKISKDESSKSTESKIQEIIPSKPEEIQKVSERELISENTKSQNVIDDNEINSFEILEQRESSIRVQEETDKQVTIVIPSEQNTEVVEENSEIISLIQENEPETQKRDIDFNIEQNELINLEYEQSVSQNKTDENISVNSTQIKEKEVGEQTNMIDNTENIDLSLNIIDEKIDDLDLNLKTRENEEQIEQNPQIIDKQTYITTNQPIEIKTSKIEKIPNEERSDELVKEEKNENINITDQESSEINTEPEKNSNKILDKQNEEEFTIQNNTNETNTNQINQNEIEKNEKIEIISPSKLNLKIDGITSKSDESISTMLAIEPEKEIPEIIDQKSEQTTNNSNSDASSTSSESNKSQRVKWVNLGGLGKPSKLRRKRTRPKVVYEISFTDDFVETIDFK